MAVVAAPPDARQESINASRPNDRSDRATPPGEGRAPTPTSPPGDGEGRTPAIPTVPIESAPDCPTRSPRAARATMRSRRRSRSRFASMPNSSASSSRVRSEGRYFPRSASETVVFERPVSRAIATRARLPALACSNRMSAENRSKVSASEPSEFARGTVEPAGPSGSPATSASRTLADERPRARLATEAPTPTPRRPRSPIILSTSRDSSAATRGASAASAIRTLEDDLDTRTRRAATSALAQESNRFRDITSTIIRWNRSKSRQNHGLCRRLSRR